MKREEFVAINTIEEGLEKLCRFGRPRLSQMDDGCWLCALDMFVQGVGVEFKIRSDYKLTDPRSPIIQALERVYDTLAKFGGKS